MAQKDIALMGAVYPDVPAVTLPIDGGGTAVFTDVSDSTATASDVASGKYFYTAAGVKTEGTASGGGGGAAVITDTTDTHGGTIRTITTADEYYIQESKTVTPSSSQQVITPDSGYDALESVTVEAVAAGSVSVSATKGTVSNHSVSVTPSATKTAGLITSGTVTGTAVTVTASELASGNKAITENGTNIDVVGYSTVSVDVAGGGGGGSVTQDENGYIVLPSTGGGGGGSAQTATGTFSGNGTISATISCSFAPDLILVHGDLSGTASLRGVVHFLIIKDSESLQVVDGSNSAYSPSLYNEVYGISGYGGTSYPYATYSNSTLTLSMVQDTSSTRWASGVTYNYTLVKWTS